MKPIVMTKIAIDTNILIYGHDKSCEHKQDIARTLIVKSPVVSTQVVSEYINVLRRIMPFPKENLLELCFQTLENCIIKPVDISTLKQAKHIIHHYDLQIFDSIIVASAIESGCEILFPEDMQHNLNIDNQLKIINPFL